MGVASRVSRRCARICVAYPRMTVAMWIAVLAVVLTTLAFLPITLDAGVEAFRVRRNVLADRENSYQQIKSRFIEYRGAVGPHTTQIDEVLAMASDVVAATTPKAPLACQAVC